MTLLENWRNKAYGAKRGDLEELLFSGKGYL